MIFHRTPIPPKWQSTYEDFLCQVEKQIALVAGWLITVILVIYQVNQNQRGIDGNIHIIETLLRAPVMLVALFTLFVHYTKKPKVDPGLLLRVIALSVMGLSLSLFVAHALYSPDTLYQMSNVLMIGFFGVSMLSVRGLEQWWTLFIIPLMLFFAALVIVDLKFKQLLPFLFDPLVMIFVGMVVSRSLTQLRRSEFLTRQQLKSLALTDQLTGLLNRHAIHTSLEQLVARYARHGHPFSLILGDLDKFKRVNDSYGHNVGDDVLIETANRLQDHVRAGDIVCRWGGEELLVVLPDTELDSALAVAEKLRCAVGEAPMAAGGHSIKQTISFGVTCYHNDEHIDTTIMRADSALYLAKEGGRNRAASVEPGAGAPDSIPATL
ncbi:GGDEF domain-containing protein [Marinobacter psychrophilus]|uniref:GGDEF domain-containing protein n=1 Tax=Marinobacter psychrophilus TaxID=330734 RepID=UPI001B5E33E3|nr:GGDEF domain-containing protein [Marinobacter psychrophilus]MBQ0764267.1 GGDEF domain-containing protein [Marinobacter psychrophilus]MBQ0845047.1 GGDEF domain-containing protein [Marinobacter psychrophilus]